MKTIKTLTVNGEKYSIAAQAVYVTYSSETEELTISGDPVAFDAETGELVF